MDFPLNFKGTKVLITGHTGFKGSWLTLWLLRLGAKIIGYSLPPDTKPSLFELLNLKREIVHIEEDIRNYKYLEGVFQEFAPEIVFHLAAQPLVKRSYLEPRLTYETNVMGTLNVLEAIRKTESVRVCIVVTSDKCYENKEWIYGYREKDPLGGDDPYSSSKACAEILTQAYRKSFFSSTNLRKTHQVVVATVRAGNVMGGRRLAGRQTHSRLY
ncbi:MAG: CDP-glucose 4,6-dehydratase [Thermodesulfobacteriaceae bacterium]|nr:CDP-glucose 4,6-dehydratase [Thermodesulfobacteriaceae bacterium]